MYRRCPINLFQRTRRVHCYFYLILWIIIFTTVLYWVLTRVGSKLKTVTSEEEKNPSGRELSDQDHPDTFQRDDYDLIDDEAELGEVRPQATSSHLAGGHDPLSFPGIERLCNRPELIQRKDEYLSHPDFKLEAVIILFRHGDRGPLSHIGHHRNISHVSCHDSDPQYLDLVRFAGEMGKLAGYAQFIGPFHSFPRIPQGSGCSLGQLTTTGAIQLLTIGNLVRAAYDTSGIFGNGTLNVKVTAYSTRYRRTFQSLLAFLYGLLGSQGVVPSVTITESQSTAFCFNHCSCRAAEGLKKAAISNSQFVSKDKLDMSELVTELSSLLELGKDKKSGASLLDSLLVYACHKSPLPCRRRRRRRKRKRTESAHEDDDCITPSKLERLIDLIEVENQGLKETQEQYQQSLLSSYGLVKEILNLCLRMTSTGSTTTDSSSGSKVRMSVFSGHDKTLQGLLGALGVDGGHPDLNLLPYASRFLIEIYRMRTLPQNSPRKHFLRFIYNGVAITSRIQFCHDSLLVAKDSSVSGTGAGVELCPLESLVKFFHDTYFDPFPKGVVNFKDACRSSS